MARILTLNTGLAGFRLLGRQIYAAVPFIDERLRALPEALRAVPADVVCLQEIMHPAHKRGLAAALAELYPFASGTRDTAGALGSGLMLLSRHPIAHARVVPFRSGPLIERVFSQRALMDCAVTIPDLGCCRIVNVHLTAGGVPARPESPRVRKHRGRQIGELLTHTAAPTQDLTLIAGDLNTGPGASQAHYRQLLEGGYRDAFTEAADADDAKPARTATWDPANPLHNGGSPTSRAPQRIDHVLLREDALGRYRVTEAAVVLHEPRVPLGDREPIGVSDHFGLVAQLSRL
jgi:endonuclease/exonuclease/phosphatase family metal-dependent hydrolase